MQWLVAVICAACCDGLRGTGVENEDTIERVLERIHGEFGMVSCGAARWAASVRWPGLSRLFPMHTGGAYRRTHPSD